MDVDPGDWTRLLAGFRYTLESPGRNSNLEDGRELRLEGSPILNVSVFKKMIYKKKLKTNREVDGEKISRT